MPPAQHYPEPTVGALIYDPAFWQPRHFIFFDYTCRTEITDVRLNDEAEAYVWLPVDEALRLLMDAYTERAIRAYLAQQAGRSRE